MLIYNHQKEFLGITEEDLATLGFSDLADLRLEVSDFADLFVKTPGFVHNFKHVHWIDFVTCAESNDDAKVIIRAADRNFKCILNIEISYLIDEPSKKAYIVNLVNLRELSKNENDKVSMDTVQRSTPKTSTATQDAFDTPKPTLEPKTQIIKEETPKQNEPTITTLPEIKTEDIIEETPIIMDDTPLDLDDFDTDFSELNEIDVEETQDEEKPTFETPTEVDPTPASAPQAKMYVEALNAGLDYVYNPQVASDELGLPVDLIEEFIEDFIAQAIEFKDDLYQSLEDNDTDHVKVLSHKLKGVAANLRIEDAFEVLATINTSDDPDEVMRNMNTLYLIIDKLAGKEHQITAVESLDTSAEEDEDDDDLIFGFKDDDLPLTIDEPLEVQKDNIEELTIDSDYELSLDAEEEDEISLAIDEPLEAQEDVIEEAVEKLSIGSDDEISLALDEPFGLEQEDEINLEIEEDKEDELLPTIEISDFDDDFLTEDIPVEIPSTTEYCKDSSAQEIGIDKESFDDLFTDYIAETKELSTKIKDAIAQEDTSSWKRHAVIIKGMSDNMRIDNFTTELESIINSTDTEIASDAIDTIDAKLQQLSQMEV